MVRKIRKTILVPAMKEARKIAGMRATIIGDRLIVNGKRYTFDKIPKKWSGQSQSYVSLVVELLFFPLLLSCFFFLLLIKPLSNFDLNVYVYSECQRKITFVLSRISQNNLSSH